MLAPGAFLEFPVQELPWGKQEGKARRERRAEKVCWQVQLGLGYLTLQCPQRLGDKCQGGDAPLVGNLGLWELQKILGIVKSP